MTAIHIRRCALACLLLAGCGGHVDVPSPPPVAVSPPPQASSPRPAAAAAAAKPNAAAAAKNTPPAKQATVPPGAFLVGGSEPNFRVLPRDERPELQAFLINPDPGVNSSLITLVNEKPGSPSPGIAPPLPAGFVAASDSTFDPSGLPTLIRCEKDGALMALVPGGLAVQGADGSPNASPRHPIDVDTFYMDTLETTVERFQKFRDATKGDKTPPAPPVNASFPQQPAVGVNWRDAMLYAKWAGKELPTESEWEKAARGTKGFLYPWGDGRPIWERRREPGQLDDAGSFRTDDSVFGVLDMAGNAREWCQDFYADDAYRQAPAAGSAAARNWAGPKSDKGGRRVVKGNPSGWEVWAREGLTMNERSPLVGFRCVLRIKGAPAAKTAL